MNLKTIYVKTTGTCNLDCSHCFTSGKNGDKTQFDPEKTAAWINDFMAQYDPGNTGYHLEIHGGEPFLVPLEKLEDFASRFGDMSNVSMCANSNLVFKLTDGIIDFIKKYFDSRIGTSWDHWIRFGNDKQLALWKANLVKLKSHDISIHLKVSISKQMVAMTPDWFLDQMESFGVTDVALERLTVGGNSVWNPDVFPDNNDQDNWYLAVLKRYKERKLSFAITTLDNLIMKIKYNVLKVDTNCRNCEQNLVTINSNGSLGGCPNMASQHKHATIEEGAKVFLDSDGRVDEIARELTFPEGCLHCDVFDLCGGDCHRLPWQNGRCGGLKNTLRYLSGRDTQSNIILKV